jgi:hypothetical protein
VRVSIFADTNQKTEVGTWGRVGPVTRAHTDDRRPLRIAMCAAALAMGPLTASGNALAPAARAQGAHGSVQGAPAPGTFSPPPALQALEQKMEQLKVSSERYTQTTHSTYTVTRERRGGHGKRIGKRTTKSLDVDELGEASLMPARGQVFGGAPGKRKPLLIAVGATLYARLGTALRGGRGRPWVRLHNTGATNVGVLFPYHGQPDEVSLGGSGAYAGLINLLATAVDPIGVSENVVVDGQATTEFMATVEPLRLVKGIPAKLLNSLRRKLPPEQLEVFITEAGLPVRVVLSEQMSASPHAGASTMSRTTDILAVNIPVAVKRPPARLTIGEKALAKLLHAKHSAKHSAKRSASGAIEIG